MENSNRGVGIEQYHGGGLANNVTAADDDGFAPRDRNVAALENLEDSSGRAGHKARPLRGEKPDVHGMKSVDVFGGVNRHQHFLCVDLSGQRQLHEYSVDIFAPVDIFHERQQFGGGGGFGRGQFLAVDADFLAGFDLPAHVNLRSRIVSDQHDRQSGTHSGGSHGLHFRSHFAADVLRDLGSVEDEGWHSGSREILSHRPQRALTTETRRHGGSVRAIHGRERGRPSIEDLHCHFLVLLRASVSPWGKAFVSRVTKKSTRLNSSHL